jgi:hypothetical protein
MEAVTTVVVLAIASAIIPIFILKFGTLLLPRRKIIFLSAKKNFYISLLIISLLTGSFSLLASRTNLPLRINKILSGTGSPTQSNLWIYDAEFESAPYINRKFQAKREIQADIEAPRSVYVKETYDIKISFFERTATKLSAFAAGRHEARLTTPSYISSRPDENCLRSSRKDWISCPTSKNGDSITFHWKLDSTETTKNASHSILIPDILRLYETNTTGNIKDLDLSGKVRPDSHKKITNPKIHGGNFQSLSKFPKINETTDYSLVLQAGGERKNVKNENIVRLNGDIEVNIETSSITLPIKVLTDLGVDRRIDAWLKLLGAILAALLGAGFGGWILQNVFRKRTQ